MNKKRACHCSFLLGGRVVVAGGHNGNYDYLNTVEFILIIEPMEKEKWTTSTHLLPYKVYTLSCAAHGEIAVLSGGYDEDREYLEDILIISPDMAVRKVGELKVARRLHVTEVIDGKFVIIISRVEVKYQA